MFGNSRKFNIHRAEIFAITRHSRKARHPKKATSWLKVFKELTEIIGTALEDY